MNKDAKVPAGFPIGRLRLTKHLSALHRARTPGRTLPPLTRANGGTPPRWDGRTPLKNVTRQIQARSEGTLAQFVAARSHPTQLRTQFPPTLDTASRPVFENPQPLSPGPDAPQAAVAPKLSIEEARELLKKAFESRFSTVIRARGRAFGRQAMPTRPRISQATGAATFRDQLAPRRAGAQLA